MTSSIIELTSGDHYAAFSFGHGYTDGDEKPFIWVELKDSSECIPQSTLTNLEEQALSRAEEIYKWRKE